MYYRMRAHLRVREEVNSQSLTWKIPSDWPGLWLFVFLITQVVKYNYGDVTLPTTQYLQMSTKHPPPNADIKYLWLNAERSDVHQRRLRSIRCSLKSIFAAYLTERLERDFTGLKRLNQVHKVTWLLWRKKAQLKTTREKMKRGRKGRCLHPKSSKTTNTAHRSDIFGLNVFSGAPKKPTYVFFKEHISSESIKNKAHHDTEH